MTSDRKSSISRNDVSILGRLSQRISGLVVGLVRIAGASAFGLSVGTSVLAAPNQAPAEAVGRAEATNADMKRAYDQVAKYIKANRLPGKIETGIEEDYRLQNHEVMVVVETEDQLKTWDQMTRPFQIERIKGIHDHGEAKPISDAVHYVVVRQDGAEGVIGGAKPGAVQPVPKGWVLWTRYYPKGHTIFVRPPTDKDLFPGRPNSFTLKGRLGQRPMTGSYIPHQQLTQQSSVELFNELVEWMKTAFPSTKVTKSLVSDSTTVALHLSNPADAKGRLLIPVPGFPEFAHLHEDGSMHLAMSAEDRWEVMAKGWGEPHPGAMWAINAVMVYAPRNRDELEVAKTVFTASYKYAIGEVK